MSNLDIKLSDLSRADFESSFETALNSQNIKERSLVKGTILSIDSDKVIVDVGYKAEGSISTSEFKDEGGAITVEIGEVVEVYLDNMSEHELVLSKIKADQMKAWENIHRIYKNNETILGTITHRVKGGLSVDIGVKAFLPGSQVDLRPVKNLEKLIDQSYEFRIIKLNRHRGNIVLSRRALLEEERKLKRAETLKMLQIGNIMEGVVKNITEYGAFIDLGGIDGLLHVTDMTYSRINDPHEIVEVGQRMKVMVLKFEEDSKRVSLGLKQTQPDPWQDVEIKYPLGAIVQGNVSKVEDFGIFVTLEEGIEGLVHQSEISWSQRTQHPSRKYQTGMIVQAVVQEIHHDTRRLSLSVRQLEADPWDNIVERYPENAIVSGEVRNIAEFGIFVGIEEGIDGLIHVSDLSWSQRQRKPKDLYQIGDRIEARVTSIDVDKRRFSLSVKELTDDPWLSVQARYFLGQRVKGRVVNQEDFGVFVEIEDGIEGLVHQTELLQAKQKKDGNWKEAYQVDTEIMVEIRRIDGHDRKISLAEVTSKDEGDGVENFIVSGSEQNTSVNDIFGDLKGRLSGEDPS